MNSRTTTIRHSGAVALSYYRRSLKAMRRLPWPRSPRLRKAAIALLGGTALVVGLGMIFLPGPALVVIPAALAILALEFAWARRWLSRLRERVKRFYPKKPQLAPKNHE